ncbi:MAG: ParA family protein [Thermosynechococcaceae cyanobacterium]
MIITTASFKGGVGKTTTAIHLAAFLQSIGKTLLVDGDPNRSATRWDRRGKGLPFKVISEQQAAKYAKEYEHIVIDTQARPTEEDLQDLVDGCDLLILPTTPDVLSLDALLQTVNLLKSLGSEQYKILLTRVPSPPRKDGDDAREMLTDAELPLLKGRIREFVAFQKAALDGVVVNSVNDRKSGIAWNDYSLVAKEIINGTL